VVSQKFLVTKVVGLGNMHNPAKNRVKIQKFAIELAQTMVSWVGSQVKSCLVAFL
jgi:pseudouridine-5'-phosphate glycosidase